MSTEQTPPPPTYADYFPQEQTPEPDAPSTENRPPADPADDYANYFPDGDPA